MTIKAYGPEYAISTTLVNGAAGAAKIIVSSAHALKFRAGDKVTIQAGGGACTLAVSASHTTIPVMGITEFTITDPATGTMLIAEALAKDDVTTCTVSLVLAVAVL